MASVWNSDVLGGVDDQVTITLGGAGTTRIVESYEVKHAVMEQPCAFALTTGTGDTAAQLLRMAQPRTEFRLYIGGILQQTGWVDGPEASDGPGGASVPIRGRDALAEVHDAYIEADKSFGNMSLAEITGEVLKATVSRDFVLTYNNALNRRAITGSSKTTELVPDDIAPALTTKQAKDRTAKAGERWYEFLKKELDHAGAFLMATADGNFTLFSPNTNQRPITRIVRQASGSPTLVSAMTVRYKNTATTRYSSYRMLSRKGGGSPSAQGRDDTDAPDDIKPALIGGLSASVTRKKLSGGFVDQEMVDWGYHKPYVGVDHHAKSEKEAEFLARKKCAEARRANWQLVYTMPGHTMPEWDGAVWAIDTMVEVVDKRLGLEGVYYVEAVTFRRGPEGTTTELSLMRPEDLVFGEVSV